VTEKKTRSLSYQGSASAASNLAPAEEVAVGKLTVVCASKGPDGRLQAVPFPAELAAKIEELPPRNLLAPIDRGIDCPERR
jgi:hypothetical protein